MIGACLIPVMILLLLFVYRVIVRYLKSVKLKWISPLAALFLFGGMACLIGGFFVPSDTSALLSYLKRILTRGAFYWMGIMLYFVLFLSFCALIRIVLKFVMKDRYPHSLLRHLTALVTVLLTVLFSVYGIWNAHRLQVTEYELEVDKSSSFHELNLVLIADTHLGYNITVDQIRDMVELINEQDADLVLIAGDLFDNEYEAIEDPEEMIRLFQQIQSRYGVYGVWGNHDIQEKILMGFTFSWLDKEKYVVKADERMLDFAERSGIRMLYDEWVEIGDVLLYGRPDKEKINFGNVTRAEADRY